MKGKVLGFSPSSGSGAIAADNGDRFSFVAAQWRSERPIAVGTSVDFDAMAGVATEIYPVAAATLAAADLAAAPAVQKMRTLALSTLAFPLAVLLLIATFLPALGSPMASASLWGIGKIDAMVNANPFTSDDTANAAKRLQGIGVEQGQLRQMLERPGAAYQQQYINARLTELTEEKERIEQRVSDASWRTMVSSLLTLRWLVPIAAVVLIGLAWAGKPIAKASIVAGGIAIATLVVIYLYRGALISSLGGGLLGGMVAAQMDATISVGFGAWLIGVIGVGLILAGLGIVRNPLAEGAK